MRAVLTSHNGTAIVYFRVLHGARTGIQAFERLYSIELVTFVERRMLSCSPNLLELQRDAFHLCYIKAWNIIQPSRLRVELQKDKISAIHQRGIAILLLPSSTNSLLLFQHLVQPL